MMTTNVIKVGILSKEMYIRRSIAIARGEYKPKKGEPKVWFESLRSMAEALSSDNQELLRLIAEKNPQSLSELETISGRKKSNLSRTLKMLEGYGIVAVKRQDQRMIPSVKATHFKVEFGLNLSQFDKSGGRSVAYAGGR
jgi:predicted transcriptional regulator